MSVKNLKSLFDVKRVHMIGVAGVGMTALAQVLRGRGICIDGSDISEDFITVPVLRKNHICNRFFHDDFFCATHIASDTDVCISSAAYLRDSTENPEVEAARQKGTLISYSEAVAMLVKEHETIAVAGSNGKTTTTAILGHVFTELGFDPTVIVGGEVLNWNAYGRAGTPGGLLILEADEYKDAFLKYRPLTGSVVTNIAYDHPDYFADEFAYLNSFRSFIRHNVRKDGFVIGCGDDANVRRVMGEAVQKEKITYGFGKGHDVSIAGFGDAMFICGTDELYYPLYGRHTMLDCIAAMQAAYAYCRRCGISDEAVRPRIASAIRSFRGVRRRFQIIRNGAVTVVDDYAHHPDAVRACISSARARYPQRRIVAVFQPHTFSRTKALMEEFAESLGGADVAVVTDIYASARESATADLHAADLNERLFEYAKRNMFIPWSGLVHRLKTYVIEKGDVVLMMGAGDIWKAARDL